MYKEIEGDLIKLSKEGKFDVIVHGCNCFCRMKRGIAPQMAKAFGCNKFPLEQPEYQGEINKLGQIDYLYTYDKLLNKSCTIVNAYTQYHWDSKSKPFNYEAFGCCLTKINHIFKGKHIGLPQIGAGLAGGDWNIIRYIIINKLKDMKVTVVIYKP